MTEKNNPDEPKAQLEVITKKDPDDYNLHLGDPVMEAKIKDIRRRLIEAGIQWKESFILNLEGELKSGTTVEQAAEFYIKYGTKV